MLDRKLRLTLNLHFSSCKTHQVMTWLQVGKCLAPAAPAATAITPMQAKDEF